MELPNYIKTLEKAGVNRKQAEAHVQINFEFMEKRMEKYATKEDLNKVEARLSLELEHVKLDIKDLKIDVKGIKKDIKDLEITLEQKIVSKLNKSIFTMISVATAVITVCGYLF